MLRGWHCFLALLVFIGVFGVIIFVRRMEAVKAVFKGHAAALRARASAAQPGSAEQAALEAEANDVEAAAADWPAILRNEKVMDGQTSILGKDYMTRGTGFYTPEHKSAAADERTALLGRHSATAFDGVREAASPANIWRDAFLWALIGGIIVFVILIVVQKSVLCNAPPSQLCFKGVAPTYTCALGADGTCVATPI